MILKTNNPKSSFDVLRVTNFWGNLTDTLADSYYTIHWSTGGKTMCYTIPALLLPGIAIVVSPLIALVQDQIRTLTEAGVNAGFLNSSQTAGELTTIR